MKIKTPNLFDLIQNSKTIYRSLNKTNSFSDYVNEASRIYFNLKRSQLSSSEFSQKTGISKSILALLGAMKKLDGDYWHELHLKINEINTYIDQNLKQLNNIISLIENCPIENGYRKYNIEVLSIIFANQSSNNRFFFDYLNIIGFDIDQYEKCKLLADTTKVVQADIKKSKKIKQEKMIVSFKDHPIIIDVKLNSSNWKDDIGQKLHIVSRYRELFVLENNYTFKQFCIDSDLFDKFKSLNYYHLNFDKTKEKFDKSQKGIAAHVQKLIKSGEIFNEDTRGDGGKRIVSESGAIGSRITTNQINLIDQEFNKLNQIIIEKDQIIKERDEKISFQSEEIKELSFLIDCLNDEISKVEDKISVQRIENENIKQFNIKIIDKIRELHELI